MSGQTYINFPIQLVHGFLTNKEAVMKGWLYYHLFNESTKLHSFRKDEEAALEEAAANNGISLGIVRTVRQEGSNLFYKYPPSQNPITGITKEMFFEYRDEVKTEKEYLTLLAFLALKSILGNKPYIKLGNDFFISRIDGHLKKAAPGKISKEVKKWSSDYKLQRLKSELIQSWGLVHYGIKTRGFYISFELNLFQLAEVAEQKRREGNAIYHEQKRIENEARNAAILKLFNPVEQ